MGTVEPRKDITILGTAWKRTSARKQGIQLIVAGRAARKAVFNAGSSGEDALTDPTIHQVGSFSDEHLPLLYQGTEALVFTSLAEGFGLPILEAMACGTPVLNRDDPRSGTRTVSSALREARLNTLKRFHR